MAVPSDLSGLRLWVKADGITGLSDGDPVATWPDSSGNGFNATQATSSKRPLYKTNIAPTGLPVVRFDNVDDCLDGTTFSNLMNATYGVYTIMAAVYVTASGTGANSWTTPAILADQAGFVGMHVKDVSGALWFRTYNWDGNEDFSEYVETYSTWLRLCQTHDNTNLAGYDGSMATALGSMTSGATSAGATGYRIGQGSGSFIGGDVGEICVWNRVLTATERQDMAQYLSDRWISAPAGGAGTYDEPGVTYDDADSQYDNFVGDTGTPVSGSDSFTLSEASGLTIMRSVTDGFTLTEASALSQGRSVTDSGTLTDAAALTQARDVTDSFTFSDSASLAIQILQTGSDSFTLSDSAAVTMIDLKNVSDSFSLSEARTLSALLSVIDNGVLSEALTIAAALAGTDSATLSDSAVLTTLDLKTGSDSFAFTEAVARTLNFSVSDAATLVEAAALAAAVSAADSAALTEARALSGLFSVSDAGTLAEQVALLSFDAKFGTDSFTLSENRTLSALLSVLDAVLLTEAVTVAASVTATDLATLTESFVGGQQAFKTGTDSATLSELGSLLQTTFKTGSDSATLSEAVSIAAAISSSDGATLSESIVLQQLILKAVSDSGLLTEDASLVTLVGSPYTHMLPPQFVVGEYASAIDVFDAVASGVEPVYAALVVGTHSAQLIVFDAEASGIVLDLDGELEGEYQADGTLT